MPRAAMDAQQQGRPKPTGQNVFTILCDPFLLGEDCLVSEPGSTSQVILAISPSDLQKSKLTLQPAGSTRDDIAVKFTDVHQVHYWGGDPDTKPYVQIDFVKKSKGPHAKLLDEVYERPAGATFSISACRVTVPDQASHTDDPGNSMRLFMRNYPSPDAWLNDPSSPEDMLLHLVATGWNGPPDAYESKVSTEHFKSRG